MSQYHSFNGHQFKKKKRSLLFDRVQTDERISDFRKFINKNVNIYHCDEFKRTILMFSAQNYHFEVFTYLINNYPKLLLKYDNKDMNIMHYIASSKVDDNQMVELITNKKFSYNKLVWSRDIHGNLPKDIAKQCNNNKITKSFELIMHDTLSEYHYIARNNNKITIDNIINNNNNNNNNINNKYDSDTYCEDMDMENDIELKQQTIPYRAITICSRKRLRQHSFATENDEYSNYYPAIPSMDYCKRRKLNSINGSYLRTTPTQPNISPSPLPPLPPIQLTPLELNSQTSNDFNIINDSTSSSTQSSLFNNNNHNHNINHNLPQTFLSLSTGHSIIPKLVRHTAVDNTNINNNHHHDTSNKYQIIGNKCRHEIEEISSLYYSGQSVTKQQFMFVKWYKKRIGNMQYLPIIIQKGYDNLNKFMTLNKQMCIQLFGDGIINNCPTEMDHFNERMRDLQLSPQSNESMTNNESNNCKQSMNQSMTDLTIQKAKEANHLISDIVINSSDSISISVSDDINNLNNVISFPWACGQCDISEDDDL